MGWHKADKDRINNHQWVGIRALVLDRDGWACVKDGRKGRLEVDHILPMHQRPDIDMYDDGKSPDVVPAMPFCQDRVRAERGHGIRRIERMARIHGG